MKISKRRQYIIDRINSGAILCTGRDFVVLSTPAHINREPDEHIQISLFHKMVHDGIFYQQLSPPFYFYLSEQYIKSKCHQHENLQ